MPLILNGRECAKSLYDNFDPSQIAQSGLAILTTTRDPASKVYVMNKVKACQKIGLYCQLYNYGGDFTTSDLIRQIDELNKDDRFTGIIVQLPLPPHINLKAVQMAIDPRKDVDGFRHDSPFLPCTPEGIITLLKYFEQPITGQKCVVLGRSEIVGKPMAHLLTSLDNTVTLCHSKTPPEYRDFMCRHADLIVSAVGIPSFVRLETICHSEFDIFHDRVTYSRVGPKLTLIDVGINRSPDDNKICGDIDPSLPCDFCCKAYTPVPGGVGPMTVATLLRHTIEGPTVIKELNK